MAERKGIGRKAIAFSVAASLLIGLILGGVIAYNIGTERGFNLGFEKGYDFGIEEGYNVGFREGQEYVIWLLEQSLGTRSLKEEGIIVGSVSYEVWRNGVLIHKSGQHNLIMTIGKKYLRNILCAYNITSGNATKALSLGTDGSVNAGMTKLTEITGNGLARIGGVSVTVTVLNSTAYKVEYTWTATGSQTVSAMGIHWSPTPNSDNNMFAAGTVTSVSLLADDQFKGTYTINIP